MRCNPFSRPTGLTHTFNTVSSSKSNLYLICNFLNGTVPVKTKEIIVIFPQLSYP